MNVDYQMNMDLHYFSNLWTTMEGSKNRKKIKKPKEEYPTLFFFFFPFFFYSFPLSRFSLAASSLLSSFPLSSLVANPLHVYFKVSYSPKGV